MDMPLFPGDPLTPGIGATKNARRLKIKDAPTLTRIPVLPISYADAKPLLAALGGPIAPAKWRGALEMPFVAHRAQFYLLQPQTVAPQRRRWQCKN